MRWTVPNLLTALRLLAAPCLGLVHVVLVSPYADWVALVLFMGAAATDWLDGRVARSWNQVSAFGRMLDPIADKAMVMIALLVVSVLSGGDVLVVAAVVLIMFREVSVSGLREFLGAGAAQLRVTRLAKWKTSVQMFAIILLLAFFVTQHYVAVLSYGMDYQMAQAVLSGELEDVNGLRRWYFAFVWTWQIGIWSLWLAAVMTLVSGADYFLRALPILRQTEK